MTRIRNVLPELFANEEFFELTESSGLGSDLYIAFLGICQEADCMGLFEWRPRQLQARISPYKPVDFKLVLETLVKGGLVVRYDADGKTYGWVRPFHQHGGLAAQAISSKEWARGPHHPEPKAPDYVRWRASRPDFRDALFARGTPAPEPLHPDPEPTQDSPKSDPEPTPPTPGSAPGPTPPASESDPTPTRDSSGTNPGQTKDRPGSGKGQTKGRKRRQTRVSQPASPGSDPGQLRVTSGSADGGRRTEDGKRGGLRPPHAGSDPGQTPDSPGTDPGQTQGRTCGPDGGGQADPASLRSGKAGKAGTPSASGEAFPVERAVLAEFDAAWLAARGDRYRRTAAAKELALGKLIADAEPDAAKRRAAFDAAMTDPWFAENGDFAAAYRKFATYAARASSAPRGRRLLDEGAAS